MHKVRNRLGFTLTEVLLAVGIIVILAGVVFLGIASYQRDLVKLEDDGFAREIFVAAQNHLTMVKSQGYLGRTGFGTPEIDEGGKETGVYYFLVNVGYRDEHGQLKDLSNGYLKYPSTEDPEYAHKVAVIEKSVLNQILPAASVEEQVRLSGCYVVRYHKDSGQMLDVFFWKDEGRFSYRPEDAEGFLLDYAKLLTIAHGENPKSLNNFGDKHSVIGWYGGDATGLKSAERTMEPPAILLRNEDKLTVTVTDVNDSAVQKTEGYQLKLVVRGVQSKRERTIVLRSVDNTLNNVAPADARISGTGTGTYTVTLDDITGNGLRFHELKDNSNQSFYPGEDISIQAVASNTTVLSNVAYSAQQQTNSLFGKDTDTATGVATIEYIRHLENLDPAVSMVNNTAYGGVDCPTYGQAEQTRQLRWQNFLNPNACGPEAQVFYTDGGAVKQTEKGTYLPVCPEYKLIYNGNKNGVYGVKVRSTATRTLNALGLFGTVRVDGSAVRDLELVDFDIQDSTGTEINAGALAGTLLGSITVENVVAYNSDAGQYEANVINGTGSVGGLVGSTNGACGITNCAAAVRVSGGSYAGGLVGFANGSTAITNCHSGGHTDKGEYYTHKADGRRDAPIYNVTGSGSVGGLVGKFSGTSITYSYSTCSAQGSDVGGLVGEADGTVSISSCYATGLVSGSTRGAFAGSFTGTVSATNCRYFETINKKDEKTYLTALGDNGTNSGITALDTDTGNYSSFTAGAWNGVNKLVTVEGKTIIVNASAAMVYDTELLKYYKGEYPLRTSAQLGATVTSGSYVEAHYGDWPAPETFVINIK